MSEQTSAQSNASVLNVEDANPMVMEKGSRFGSTIRPLAGPTGATKIGCNHYEVAPGRSAFPFHYHCAIEEALYILEGTGTLRLGDARREVRPGDWVSLPAGPDHAHQLLNTGTGPLRYLCLSSKATADVVVYPDSDKVAAMASPSVNFFDTPWVKKIFRAADEVDYYDGEDIG